MERRTFIKGLLTSVSAGTALVQLATAEDVRVLALNKPIMLTQPRADIIELAMGELETVIYVKRSGEYLPFGYITNIHMRRDTREAPSMYDGYVTYVPGLLHGELSFTGPTL